MADYRESCSNPSCGWNGFNSHSPGCPVPQESWNRAREARRKEREYKMNKFRTYSLMEKAELFEYLSEIDDTIRAARQLENERDLGLEFLRGTNLTSEYLDYRRDRRDNERT